MSAALALIMPYIAEPLPPRRLAIDRATETVVGIAVSSTLILAMRSSCNELL
jgi:hypothetical protein